MWQDPIVEEIRRYREEYAAQFNYDLDAICRDLREQEKKSGATPVSLPPRAPRTRKEGKGKSADAGKKPAA